MMPIEFPCQCCERMQVLDAQGGMAISCDCRLYYGPRHGTVVGTYCYTHRRWVETHESDSEKTAVFNPADYPEDGPPPHESAS